MCRRGERLSPTQTEDSFLEPSSLVEPLIEDSSGYTKDIDPWLYHLHYQLTEVLQITCIKENTCLCCRYKVDR